MKMLSETIIIHMIVIVSVNISQVQTYQNETIYKLRKCYSNGDITNFFAVNGHIFKIFF